MFNQLFYAASLELNNNLNTSPIRCYHCTVIINAFTSAHTVPVYNSFTTDFTIILLYSRLSIYPYHTYNCPLLTGFLYFTKS